MYLQSPAVATQHPRTRGDSRECYQHSAPALPLEYYIRVLPAHMYGAGTSYFAREVLASDLLPRRLDVLDGNCTQRGPCATDRGPIINK